MKARFKKLSFLALLFLFLSAFGAAFLQTERSAPGIPRRDGQILKEFEEDLETLRRQLRIPGMAAGVLKDQELVWAKGFGYADLENKIDASISTPWHIASVTKTFAAIILLQLVEEGKLSLDDPLEKFGIQVKSRGVVRVKHILTHTSERRPGTFFRYSGRLWEHLAQVIKAASGKSFKELLVERIIRPLKLADTAPNKEAASEAYPFDDIRNRGAVLYGMDESFNPRRSEFELGFYAAGGLFSSVKDMAKYVTAIDNDLLLKPETKKMMFTPFSGANGKAFPHGLGWFTQVFRGKLVVWHFGWHPDHASALILKVPERNLTFMVFANTDKLSQPFNLLRGNVLNSPAALLFLKRVVFPDEEFAEITDKEAVTNDIILKTSGRKPVLNPVQKGILIGTVLSFLSAPILWTSAWMLRKRRSKKKVLESYKVDWGSGTSRIYALLSMTLCVLFYAALLRAPFLVYWPELPGWIDGISLEENIFLALPTLLVLLGFGLIMFTIRVWLKKYWSFFERLHYAWLAVATIGYLLLLNHWHLIGISYYWNYFIR
jgi:CubicO group peptidase (beta-lactamase class C family)